jgi:hypothetical protein
MRPSSGPVTSISLGYLEGSEPPADLERCREAFQFALRMSSEDSPLSGSLSNRILSDTARSNGKPWNQSPRFGLIKRLSVLQRGTDEPLLRVTEDVPERSEKTGFRFVAVLARASADLVFALNDPIHGVLWERR